VSKAGKLSVAKAGPSVQFKVGAQKDIAIGMSLIHSYMLQHGRRGDTRLHACSCLLLCAR
jgi:hypothetical protein